MDSIIKVASGLLVGGYALFQYSRDENKKGKKDAAAPTDAANDAPASNAVQVVHHHHYYNADGELVAAKPQTQTKKAAKVQNTIKYSHDDNETASSCSTDDDGNNQPSWMASQSALAPEDKEAFANINAGKASDVKTSTPSVRTTSSAPRTLATASASISKISYALSDTVFVYPGAGERYLGADVSSLDGRNAFGYSVQVEVLDTRAGAAEAVLGALSNGSRASVLASSASLKEMLPSIFEMAQQRLPGVFHVSTFSVDDELAVRQDLSEVMAIRGAGVPLLVSGSAQEAHDFAVLAHVLSQRASTPMLHVVDGSRVAHQLASVNVASPELLFEVANKHSAPASPTSLAGLEAASHADMPHLACVMQQTMRQLSPAFGKEYAIFEYSGVASPDAVIIAMGTVASVIEDTVRNSTSVGVIKVRLLQPWSAAHLLEALPASARRVCVIDQSEGLPLFAEVAASLHSNAALERAEPMPLLVGGRLLPTVNGFSPAMVYSVVSNLMADRPQPGFNLGGNSPSSLHADYLGGARIAGDVNTADAVKRLIVFASQKVATQVDMATQAVAHQVAAFSKASVQQLSTVDTYTGDAGVIRSELRLSSSPNTVLPEAYEIADAQHVVVEQALLSSAGPAAAAALGDSGTLIVVRTPVEADPDATEEEKEAAEANLVAPALTLPFEVRSILARKNAKVVTVDTQSLTAFFQGGELQVASIWLALGAALHLNKSVDVAQLTGALQIVKPFGEDFSAVNALGASLGRVDGYMTKINSNVAFSGPSVGKPTGSFEKNDLVDIETTSFASAGMGSAALSPIHPAVSNHTRFVPRLVIRKPEPSLRAGLGGKTGGEIVKLNHKAALTKIFPEAYSTEAKLRPSEHGVHLVRLTKNQRLTPGDYDRNIFHLEFDISDTDLSYEIGDALGVYGHNDVAEIDQFIAEYGLNPSEIVSIPARGQMESGSTELVSVRNLLIQHLDLLGKPNKKFYVALAAHATSRYEYLKLMHTGTDDNEAFKLGVNEGTTYADLLLHYKTANPTIEQIIEMVPPIKARHYSIASSMKMNPRSVHLLVVAVDWVTPLGRKKYGQCTRYLANLDTSKGDVYVAVDVMPSVLRLPPLPSQPIVMAGLGTGLAPFRAFMQHRKWQKEMGMEVGPCVLYFGARHRHEEYLYGDEWDAYEKEGLLKLGLAFSRDQPQKVYIQDKIAEDKVLLSKHLGTNSGYFYLCGPTWPVPAVAKAISEALNPEAAARGEVDFEQVENLKQDGRYILEVY